MLRCANTAALAHTNTAPLASALAHVGRRPLPSHKRAYPRETEERRGAPRGHPLCWAVGVPVPLALYSLMLHHPPPPPPATRARARNRCRITASSHRPRHTHRTEATRPRNAERAVRSKASRARAGRRVFERSAFVPRAPPTVRYLRCERRQSTRRVRAHDRTPSWPYHKRRGPPGCDAKASLRRRACR